MELPKLPEKDIISYDYAGIPIYAYTADQIQDYARKAVLMEREACAKVCDDKATRNFTWASENSDKYHAQADWAELCAAAIRART